MSWRSREPSLSKVERAPESHLVHVPPIQKASPGGSWKKRFELELGFFYSLLKANITESSKSKLAMGMKRKRET